MDYAGWIDIAIWAWAAVMGAGAILGSGMLWIALRNRRRLKASGQNGARKIVARGNVTQEKFTVAIFGLLCYAALIVQLVEERGFIRGTWALAIILAGILLAIQTVVRFVARRRALAVLDATIHPETPLEVLAEIKTLADNELDKPRKPELSILPNERNE